MKQKKFPESILFLNENPLPTRYTKGAVSGKELRLRSALEQVKAIHVVAPKGNWVGDRDNSEIGKLEKKIMVHHIPAWPYYFRAIPLFLWGCYWSLRVKPDLIEAESPILSGPAAVLLGKMLHLPTVVEVRASYQELIKYKVPWIPYGFKKHVLNFVFYTTLKHATGVIANSHYYQNSLKKIGIKSVVINPGIQLQSFEASPSIKKPNEITFGYLGRLEIEKGVILLLEAMKIALQHTQSNQKVKLLIAGDGSQREFLEIAVTADSMLNTIVRFLGFQKAEAFLPTIDVLINPNIVNHPLEMVNVEAAYYGKPVICFGDENIPETVINKRTGIKVSCLSKDKLALAIGQFIHMKDIKSVYSAPSKLFAQNFEFTNQIKRLQLLYRNIQ